MSLIAVSPIPGHLWPVWIKCYFETWSSKKTQKVIESWMFHFGWGRFPYKLCLKWNVLWTQVINYGLKSQLDVVGFGRGESKWFPLLKRQKRLIWRLTSLVSNTLATCSTADMMRFQLDILRKNNFGILGQKIIPDFKMGHCQPQNVVRDSINGALFAHACVSVHFSVCASGAAGLELSSCFSMFSFTVFFFSPF